MSLQKVGNNAVRTSKMLDSPKRLVQSMSGKTNGMSICSFAYLFKIADFAFFLISSEILAAQYNQHICTDEKVR